MGLPAKRRRRAIVHSAATTGLVAVIVAVFGVSGLVGDVIVLGVLAIVVTLGAAYALSRP